MEILFPLVLAIVAICFVLKRRREQRRRMIHRISFAPRIEILCHGDPAEAGSSRTPGSLSRSN